MAFHVEWDIKTLTQTQPLTNHQCESRDSHPLASCLLYLWTAGKDV